MMTPRGKAGRVKDLRVKDFKKMKILSPFTFKRHFCGRNEKRYQWNLREGKGKACFSRDGKGQPVFSRGGASIPVRYDQESSYGWCFGRLMPRF